MNKNQNNKEYKTIVLGIIFVNIAIMIILSLLSLFDDPIYRILSFAIFTTIQIAVDFILAIICFFLYVFIPKPKIRATVMGFILSFGILVIISMPICLYNIQS